MQIELTLRVLRSLSQVRTCDSETKAQGKNMKCENSPEETTR